MPPDLGEASSEEEERARGYESGGRRVAVRPTRRMHGPRRGQRAGVPLAAVTSRLSTLSTAFVQLRVVRLLIPARGDICA
jgi:hypothetical protein